MIYNYLSCFRSKRNLFMPSVNMLNPVQIPAGGGWEPVVGTITGEREKVIVITGVSIQSVEWPENYTGPQFGFSLFGGSLLQALDNKTWDGGPKGVLLMPDGIFEGTNPAGLLQFNIQGQGEMTAGISVTIRLTMEYLAFPVHPKLTSGAPIQQDSMDISLLCRITDRNT
ncbi:MAG: hypothetical protein SFU56_19355 [Capsulimonadales bacterium]|nr:hypothetical protein [Capsulimonadales bacterium]